MKGSRMIHKYLFFIVSALASLSLYSADFFCNPDAQRVRVFFDRDADAKFLESLEYQFSPENLIFFATHDRLEPKIFGPGICQKTQLFITEMQGKLERKLANVNVQHKNDMAHALYGTSRHARYICNTCCALQMKVLGQEELGSLWAKTTLFLITPWTQVDAQTFYDRCCTDFYKNKSATELQALFDATK